MIDKEAPVLAFDVSKGSSHCQGYCSFGKPIGKPIKVAHRLRARFCVNRNGGSVS